jgi:hypothetical protein
MKLHINGLRHKNRAFKVQRCSFRQLFTFVSKLNLNVYLHGVWAGIAQSV